VSAPRRLSLLFASAVAALTIAAPAQAFLINSWTQLGNLTPANGANWVRTYDSGLATLYAGTEGDGVYRSTTAGVSWDAFSGGLPSTAMNIRALIGAGGGELAGTDTGIWKSTGGSWTPLAQGDEDDPANPKKLNKSVQSLMSSPPGSLLAGVFNGGVYKSTDDGATWKPPAPNNGMPPGETVWALGSLVPPAIFAATSSGIYRSLNFGDSWALASDGVTGETLRVFVDGSKPTIFYAGTTDGLFRSINAGLTWSLENGPPGHTIGNPPVRALQQFSGVNQTHLYAGTDVGVYAGITSNNNTGGFIPGPITWRPITTGGLQGHTASWALTTFLGGTSLLLGTQGGGGFGLTFAPPLNQIAPVASAPNGVTVGDTVQTDHGSWSGTPTIEYEYQWQDCGTANSPDNCNDIDGATDPTFVIPDTLYPSNTKHYFRANITAKNDFPGFGPVSVPSKASNILGPTAGALNTVPGAGQAAAGTIAIQNPADGTSFPIPGSTLHAQGWTVTPCTAGSPPGALACNYSFTWIRCEYPASNENNATCETLRNANNVKVTTQNYVLTDADVNHDFCVKVTAYNANGAATTLCSGFTNKIFPRSPVAVKPPTIAGSAYAGQTLAGIVGQWNPGAASFKRQWEQCSADGGSCSYISGAHDPSYVPTVDDIGSTLRLLVTADANQDNVFPGPVDAESAATAVVTVPPPPPVSGGGGGAGGGAGGGGGGSPQPQPQPQPLPKPPDVTDPVLGTAKLASSSVKAGSPLSLGFSVTEPGTLSVTIQRVSKGRKVKGKCKAGAHKGKRCTIYTSLATQSFAVAGAGKLAIPTKVKGKKLARGNYRLLVTPVDASGNRGAAHTVNFKIKRN
jgi:hypothetical protein